MVDGKSVNSSELAHPSGADTNAPTSPPSGTSNSTAEAVSPSSVTVSSNSRRFPMSPPSASDSRNATNAAASAGDSPSVLAKIPADGSSGGRMSWPTAPMWTDGSVVPVKSPGASMERNCAEHGQLHRRAGS